jgi:hypothetical protein
LNFVLFIYDNDVIGPSVSSVPTSIRPGMKHPSPRRRAQVGSTKARSGDEPRIRIQVGADRRERRLLAQSVREALEGARGGPWRVRMTGVLVYASPSAGAWWWKVTLGPTVGRSLAVFLDPEHHSPRDVREAVAAGVRGESPTVVCSACGRVRLGQSWHGRADLAALEHSHGICPECTERLYPDLARRGARRAKP